MKKLGILIDSFCGIKKEDVEKLGINYISQVLILDDKIIKEGEKEILTELAEKIVNAKEVKTSLPPIGLIDEKMKKMSKEYENVIFIPVNKGLSSTFSTSFAKSKEFKNVHVINTKFAGSAIIYNALKAIKNAEIKNIKDIIKDIKYSSKNSICWVLPKDVQMLIKSGRLNGVKKIFLERTKLIPQLLLTENGFQVKGIKKNFSKTIDSVIKKTLLKIKKNNEKINDYIWELIHTTDLKTIDLGKKALKENGIQEYKISLASSSTVCHSGVGAIGINTYIK